MSTPPEGSMMNVEDKKPETTSLQKIEQETTTLMAKEPGTTTRKTQQETKTLNEIKSLFQKPPHEVDNCQAQNLTKRIMESSSQDERIRRIGDALGFLYPLNPDPG
ncbi:hypothetical protein ACHWQZ_G017239 [Mnemiopsis leidyi]